MAFDPYHKWLGIPEDEQPPNHYRLLSVPQFESDADVIETAAEQRTLLLRTFQIGPEAALAERLLNEVAAARVCLLDNKAKSNYDGQLKEKLTTAEPPLTPPLPELSVAADRLTRPKNVVQWPTTWTQALWVAAGGGALVTLLVVIIPWLLGPDDTSPKDISNTHSQQQIDAAEKIGPLQAAAEKAITESAVTLKGHSGPVTGVAFSPDGKRIVSSSEDKTVRVWNADTGQLAITLKGHLARIPSVSFSPDGKRIVSGSYDKTVKVWDAETGQEILTLKGHTATVFSVAFSADGQRIASGAAKSDNTIKVWDATAGQEILTLKGHSHHVRSVVFSPDGKRIVSGSSDGTVKVWDAETSQVIETLKGHTDWVNSVAFSPDGKRIVSGSSDGTMKIWDAETGEEMHTLKEHSNTVFEVAFSLDRKRIASGSRDKTVKVWDAETGQPLLTLNAKELVTSVSFSPDGRRVVSGINDGTVKIWDLGPVPAQPTAKSPPPNLQEGLIAYYPFNGNTKDESGNGHHGVAKNVVPIRDRHGVEEKAYFFAGNGQHVSLPPFQFGTKFTVSIWSNNFAVNKTQMFFSKKPSDVLDSVQFYARNRAYRVSVYESDNLAIGRFAPSSAPTPGNWAHLLFTYDGGNTSSAIRIYKNGIRRATDPFFQQPKKSKKRSFTKFNDLNVRSEIGSQNGGRGYERSGKETFHGILDDVRIYNRALSDAEVKALYEFEKP